MYHHFMLSFIQGYSMCVGAHIEVIWGGVSNKNPTVTSVMWHLRICTYWISYQELYEKFDDTLIFVQHKMKHVETVSSA